MRSSTDLRAGFSVWPAARVHHDAGDDHARQPHEVLHRHLPLLRRVRNFSTLADDILLSSCDMTDCGLPRAAVSVTMSQPDQDKPSVDRSHVHSFAHFHDLP